MIKAMAQQKILAALEEKSLPGKINLLTSDEITFIYQDVVRRLL
jgi:hypothetical protein